MIRQYVLYTHIKVIQLNKTVCICLYRRNVYFKNFPFPIGTSTQVRTHFILHAYVCSIDTPDFHELYHLDRHGGCCFVLYARSFMSKISRKSIFCFSNYFTFNVARSSKGVRGISRGFLTTNVNGKILYENNFTIPIVYVNSSFFQSNFFVFETRETNLFVTQATAFKMAIN